MKQPKRIFLVALGALLLGAASGQPLTFEQVVGYEDSYGANIIGVVTNDGSVPLEYVQIVSSVYGANDAFLDSDYTFTMLDVLLPGEWSPFSLSIRDPGDFRTFDYQAQWQEASSRPSRVVEVVNHRGRLEGRYFTIGGQVRNAGSSPVEYVQVIAAAYDAQDNLVGVDYTFTRLDVLSAGGTSPFELSLREPLAPVARYELVVQSQPIR